MTTRILVKLLLGLSLVLSLTHRADAYPQYQLSRDTTCTGCHLSPDGGGILNENGVGVAEQTSWKGGDGNFLHGMSRPSWLELGGDFRSAAGFVDPGVASVAAYPMQAEVSASAGAHGFTLNVVGGLRRPDEGGSAIHVLWSREHYLMWQQKPGEGSGLYIRAGRMMPTFGLRLAEHIVYTQKFGGRPLYGEAYALAASYVTPSFEVHASGFVHDPIATSVEHGDGGAIYVEKRLGEHAAIGAEGKYSSSDDLHRTFGGITAKLYLPSADLQIQGEAEVIRQKIVVGAGDKATQIAAYVLASHPLGKGLMLDGGLGHFTQDTRVKGLTRDCVDLNLHWFQTSHLEWLVTARLELLDLGSGTNGGYALAQIHYRL
ncbi:MAG: hypothetical protein IPQ07_22515 [Myxococcales bacterium]|nr:hypothetical protein [Myxococcales bacterium]